MFRFTLRRLFGLTAIAAISCFLSIIVAPADPFSELLFAGFLLVFGSACYIAGIVGGQHDKQTL